MTKTRFRRGCWLILVGLIAVAAGHAARTEPAIDRESVPAFPAPEQPSLFALPAIEERARTLTLLMSQFARRGEWAMAESAAWAAVEVVPWSPVPFYNLGCLRAVAGRTDEAFAALEESVARGYADAAHLREDPDLVSLRADPRWEALLEKARRATPPAPLPPAAPLTATGGVAWVTESNTLWDARTLLLVPLYALPSTNAGDRAIIVGHGAAGDLLRQWWADGTAAGNWGDHYDNRDADHSNMDYGAFPQLTRIEYSREAVAVGIHTGLPLTLFHQGRVLGNSSTAMVGTPFWRSLPRAAYPNRRLMELLYAQYVGNQLYVYPEHKDHDPGHNGQGGGHGDVYPANTPYVIISQGSSGSDKPFLDAVAATLAAFRPDTKQVLAGSGSLMPAVQMILRRSSRAVTNEAGYLSGIAHPSVFDAQNLDLEKMVRLAHAIEPTNAPPLVQLTVLSEDRPVAGRDYFDGEEREVLFDTRCAVARVWRSTQRQRRLTVSALASRDPNGLPLTYRWAVLRGDPDGVAIRPVTDSGSQVEITLTWQGRQPILPGSPLESNRIEIGAFVHNGAHWSAPGFITFYTLDNEERAYDAAGRIRSVTYSGGDGTGNYVDPMIDLPKSWRDEYQYDEAGNLTGWIRHRGDRTEAFTAAGELILERDAGGRPVRTAKVRYVPRARAENQPPVLEQQVVTE